MLRALAAFCLAALLSGLTNLPAGATPPSRSGTVPSEVRAAFSSGVLALPERPELSVSALPSDWLVPVVLVGFSDSTMRYAAAAFQHALFDTTHSTATGSVVDYFDWVSRGQLRLRGEVVATFSSPNPLNFYANDFYGVNTLSTPNNDWGLVRDAVAAVDGTVDWSRYDRDGDSFVDMIWILHAGVGGEGTDNRRSLWSITGRLSNGWSAGGAIETDDFVPGSTRQHIRVDRFSIVPELSMFVPGAMSEIGVFCHEFGHALGLPDLYDTSQLGGAANVGPGDWSLMSTGAYGTNGHSPESPSHPGAWPMLYLGWNERLRPARDTLITLRPLADGGEVVDLWFQGEPYSEHFLLEAREATSFDRNIPSPGVLVTQVDDAMMSLRMASNRVNTGPTPGLRLLEADGDADLVTGWNHGDANDPLPGALGRRKLDDDSTPSLRTLGGAITNIAIEDVALSPGGILTQLRVQAPGWQASAHVDPAGFSPVGGGSRGRPTVATPQGTEYLVTSDSRTGRPQVVLHSRTFTGEWAAPDVVSQSPVGAFEPAVALLPGNDIATVWTDLRGGQFQIWYRARIGGVWTQARALTSSAGGSVSPAIAADAQGRVFVSWLELHSPRPILKFLAFTWASPFGTAATVSDTADSPTPPALAATRDGRVMVVWPDLAGSQPRLQFARWSPDSGMSPRLRLTSNSVYSQPACDVTTGPDDAFHIVWQQQTSGVSEIHHQRRPRLGPPSPRDTTIERSPDALQSPSVATDQLGGIHLVFERTTASAQVLRYKRWQAGRGWDFVATDVSDPLRESIARGSLVAVSPGGVSVNYVSSDGISDQMFSRRRRLDGFAAADVPESVRPADATALSPNPARAGSALLLRDPRVSPGDVTDLLDAAGRRVASVRAERAGEVRFTPAATRELPAGLYFARSRATGRAARLVVIR
ncbi:MAG: M6 family metalloprotease domain-containing protein [Candidatus Eisenbacteria bacterium]|nr:M6 family metalloprotease domain-containing protein [Candidatus Eisenbacteria bacterium]